MNDIFEKLVNTIPILTLLLGGILIFVLTINSSLAPYVLLLASGSGMLSMTARKSLSDVARFNEAVASILTFGLGVSFYGFTILSSLLSSGSLIIRISTLFVPLLMFLMTSFYVSKNIGANSLHMLPLTINTAILPLIIILGVTNPFIISGWMILSIAFMFFDIEKRAVFKKSGKTKKNKKEVNLGTLPSLELDED